MKKSERDKLKLTKYQEKVVLKLQRSAKEMEDSIERMGIHRSKYGPRISEPAHTRDTVYSYVSSTVQQDINHQSEKTSPRDRSSFQARDNCLHGYL